MSISAELDRLNELHRTGTLSDSEFDAAKEKLLAGSTGKIFGIEPNAWCMLMHLSTLLSGSAAGIIVPVVMYLVSKDESEQARRHGAATLNWAISSIIYLIASGVLCLALVGFVLVPVVVIAMIAFPIMAAVKANNGEFWSYPLAIRFFDEN